MEVWPTILALSRQPNKNGAFIENSRGVSLGLQLAAARPQKVIHDGRC